MKFDKSKILTCVTAWKANVGMSGWFSDNLMDLEGQVKSNSPKGVISDIYTMREPDRFVDEDTTSWNLFYPAPEPTYAERQAEWVKENGVKEGTRIRITKDYSEDSDAHTLGHTGVAGKCGTVNCVGDSYINVNLDSEEFYLVTVPYYAMEVIKEPTYVERQAEWVKENNVKEGTKVRVTRTFTKDEDGSCCWGHDDLVGMIGSVDEYGIIPHNLGIIMSDGNFKAIPYFALEVIKEPTYAERQAEWVKQNNIKGGTKVRFTKNFTDGEDGSGCCEHKRAKGMEGVVEYTKDDCLTVLVPYFGGLWNVPFTALEVIKEPTYRPYNNDELNDLVGEILTNKQSGRRKLVTGKPTEALGVSLDGSYITAKDLLSSFYRNTNETCGIKE